jgi:hypothetical protein
MTPIMMSISVGDYLKFEVSHNYTAGRNSCHWSIHQFNGPAIDPMTMKLFGGCEMSEYITKHLLTEIANYAPPHRANPTQSLHIRIENSGTICYEGLIEIHMTNDGHYANTMTSQVAGRFKTIFDLFTFMVPDSPI